MGFQLTAEQSAIRDVFTTGADLVAQAGAGAGKTKTLEELAKAQPGKRGLYIAYNAAIKNDAKEKFPPSTKCMTGHGLAYATVGKRYRHRLNAPRQNARIVAKILGINDPVRIDTKTPMVAPMQIARLVKETITRFCNSADDRLTLDHVPRRKGHTAQQAAVLAPAVLPYAEKAWADLSDIDGQLRFEHDNYLKLWALSNPRLRYDYLLFDEAQDTTAMMSQLVLSQKAQRVAVGDSAQAIYGWRGAIDALSAFPGQQLTLSQSFRFGPAVANQANIWLDLLDAPIRLTGFDEMDTRVVEKMPRPDAILTRTNAGAMAEAMRLMAEGESVAIVGGGAAMENLALASIDLKAGRSTDHPELLAFTTWGQVCDYAENEDDGADLRPLVDLIEEHGADEIVKAARSLSDERHAKTVISTAHKAKGREWSAVKISDDFQAPRPNSNGATYLRREEAMLCYVAVTRARLALECSALNWVHELSGLVSY